MPDNSRATGGAGVHGSYGPNDPAANTGKSTDNANDSLSISRSSGGAGVGGSYGPTDAAVKGGPTLPDSKSAGNLVEQQSNHKDGHSSSNDMNQTAMGNGREGNADGDAPQPANSSSSYLKNLVGSGSQAAKGLVEKIGVTGPQSKL